MALAAISNGNVRQSVFPFSERYGFTAMAQDFIFKTNRASQLSLSSGLPVFNGKKVAVQAGTNAYFYVTEQLIAARGLSVTVQTYATAPEAAAAVVAGTADYMFGFASEASVEAQIASGALTRDSRITTIDAAGIGTVWGTGAAFMFRPSIKRDAREAGTIKAINCAIEKLTKAGVPDQLNTKWRPGGYVYCSPDETVAQCQARQ